MEPLNPAEIVLIDSARSVEQGSHFAGLVAAKRGESTHYVKMAYIRTKLGYRAIGGFFDPTKKNVTRKFVKAWLTSHK